MNTVILIGNLTADPELRYGSTPVCKFTLAVKKDKDGADFIRITAFASLAETVNKYLRKGSTAAVRGRIQTGSYTNKEGQKVYTTDVIANEVQFLGGKPEEVKFEGNEEWQY